MGKLELKIGFNGEEIGLLSRISKFEYLVQQEDNSLVSSSYFNNWGELPSSHVNDYPKIKIMKIKDLDIVSFQTYINYNSYPVYLKTGVKYVSYYYNKDSTSVVLNKNSSDYWSSEQQNDNIITNNFRLKAALNYAITYLGALEPNDDSYIIIRFETTVPSTEQLSYNYGYIKLIFPENTSYLSYSNDSFNDIQFIRQLRVDEQPNFNLSKSDGDVNIIDKNLYIEERIKTNEIKNYFITKVLYNGNQLGKFIGINGKYPYSAKTLSYILYDYISLIENIPCGNYYYHLLEPSQGIINGYELYEELIFFTMQKTTINFAILNDSKKEYLKKFTFVDPYIKCSNLKELWQAFLTATMTNMYINNNGLIDLDIFLNSNQDIPIIINKDQFEQDLDYNLLPNNAISKVSVNTKYHSENFIVSSNGSLNIGDYSSGNVDYSTIISNYLKWLENNNTGVYNIDSPSMFFNFYEKNESTRNGTTYTYILSESFIDLGENLYQTIKPQYKLDYYYIYTNSQGNPETKHINYDNYYDYNIKWLSKNDYDELTIDKMDFNTLYFNSEEYLTQTGRIFKCLIPLSSIEVDSNSNLIFTYATKIDIKINTQEIKEGAYSYGESQMFKNDLPLQNSNLIYTDINEKLINLVFKTKKELDAYDRASLPNFTMALVENDEEHSNKRTIYQLFNSGITNINSWAFLRIDKTSRYNEQPLSVFIAETLQKLYNNGRKSIKFTTSAYNFFNSEGILQYKAENGEILKVGDLIQLPSVSNLKFKIISISLSYQGVLNLKIVAIEMN